MEIKNTIDVIHKDTHCRNVLDMYQYWTNEAIKADLDSKRHNFSILISNIYYDFHLATVIRNCNAFLGSRLYIYGGRRYDKRGTVGTHHYERIEKIQSLDALPKDAMIIGIDNVPGAEPIETFEYPTDRHIVFAFGQEQVGLPDEFFHISEKILYIQQYGSVRSLNVGCASGIVMYDYCRKVVKI